MRLQDSDRIETTSGKKPKADFLQMLLCVYAGLYLIFESYADEIISEPVTRHIVFMIASIVAVVLVLVVRVHNRKRDDIEFSQRLLFFPTATIIITAFVYWWGEWFKGDL